MTGSSGTRPAALAVWALTRALLLLCVIKVITLPGPDVTSDVSVIYHGWYDVLRSGSYPKSDVTWQYPPVAALAILSPALLPFLDYASAFFVLAFLCDALVLGLLLYAGRTAARRTAGAWVWVAGVPLLGTTAYARYDVMVTAVAVAALLAGVRHPRVLGALAAFGALLKVWPALLLAGTAPGRRTRLAWTTAAGVALGLLVLCTAAAPGALAFLGFQRDRGTEVESLGALVFHVARQFGWQGRVELHYGSLEFLGPHVPLVSTLSLGLSLVAFGWLLVWRLRARVRSEYDGGRGVHRGAAVHHHEPGDQPAVHAVAGRSGRGVPGLQGEPDGLAGRTGAGGDGRHAAGVPARLHPCGDQRRDGRDAHVRPQRAAGRRVPARVRAAVAGHGA